MPDAALAGFVKQTAEGLGVTGAAVGVRADGREVFACHGVTSVENPLPVTQHTLFLIGSVTKTFTATAVMRLVADGKVALDAPVRRYGPARLLHPRRKRRDHRCRPGRAASQPGLGDLSVVSGALIPETTDKSRFTGVRSAPRSTSNGSWTTTKGPGQPRSFCSLCRYDDQN